MPPAVLTVGHSNHPLDRFLALLARHGVEALVDIRRFPGSRKHPHFGRDNLAATRRNALVYHRNALAYAQGRHDAWRGEQFARWRDDISARLKAGEEVGI